MRPVHAAVLVSLCGCAQGPSSPTIATASNRTPVRSRLQGQEFGWVAGPCVASRKADLPGGTPVSVVLIADPQAVVPAQLGAHVRSGGGCPALADGRENAAQDVSFYELTGTSLDASRMGIALLGGGPTPTVREGLARVDLEQDGHSLVFTACAASEGIHFAVWNDQPYRGEPVWTAYYHLGVDMEPNCPR